MAVRYRLLLASEREEGDITGCVLWHLPASLWVSHQQLWDPSVETLQLMWRELSAALPVVVFFLLGVRQKRVPCERAAGRLSRARRAWRGERE